MDCLFGEDVPFLERFGEGERGKERVGERFVIPPSPYKPLINEGLNAVRGSVGGLGLVFQSDLNEDSNEFIQVRWSNMMPVHFLRQELSPRVTGVIRIFRFT